MVKRKTKSKRKTRPSWIRKFKQFRLHHKLFFYIIGSAGVILVWRGFWLLIDQTPIFSHPMASITVGVGLTIAAGVFFEVV